jgi:hypothetical protein
MATIGGPGTPMVNYTAKTGKMYSTLRSNGNRVNSVSFSIHP